MVSFFVAFIKNSDIGNVGAFAIAGGPISAIAMAVTLANALGLNLGVIRRTSCSIWKMQGIKIRVIRDPNNRPHAKDNIMSDSMVSVPPMP